MKILRLFNWILILIFSFQLLNSVSFASDKEVLSNFEENHSSASITNSSIIELRKNDSNGNPIYLNSIKTVSGIVTVSDEFGSSGIGFIQDESAGIAIYGSEIISQIATGDSITIKSKIGSFRGLSQLVYESGETEVILHKNTVLPNPEVLTISNILNQDWNNVELYEGKLVQFNNVRFIESGYFSGNVNYQITDGVNNLTIRIDGDTDLSGIQIPSSNCSIVGVVSQYDSSSPYSTGYQILPRKSDDIKITSIVSDFTSDITYGNLPLVVNFTDLSINNPTSWLWDFGDGNTNTLQNPQHIYTAVGDYTVSLTVGDGSSTNNKTKTNYISVVEGRLTTSSDNFIFYYTKPELCTDDLINAMEKKFNNLDYTIWGMTRSIYLLDRSQKIKVFLYDTEEAFVSAPSDIRDWDVGYYSREDNELHIKVPTSERQLKYFSSFEKAAISVLARYVMEKKRTNGNESSKGLSFGFGLYESGYSPDLDLIQNYLNQNTNTFPDKSTFSKWDQLDEELNVELAYTHVFAGILRRGYFSPTVYDGLYSDEKDIWYQMIRIFFLLNPEDDGMRKFVEEDDFIIYSTSQEEADLVLEGLRLHADLCEKELNTRINHPLIITIYGSYETYSYTKYGNIDNVNGGGEALSHSVLRSTSGSQNLDTELNRLFAKHNGTMQHEFTHNVEAFLAESDLPGWVNEGAAMYFPESRIWGYIGFNVQWFGKHHNHWNNQSKFFPDLDNAFTEGAEDPGFGYHMSYSAFAFIRDNVSKETLIEFIKRSDDFSTIGYSGVAEFQKHLYETLYHLYMPNFLFNPNWNLERTYTSGTNYSFNWDGHYIDNLILEYSVDETKSWNSIADVTGSSGSYSWNIPDAKNCILRFSDKKFPEINFSYQILGDKPTFGKTLFMDFENEADNCIINYKDGRIKGDVSFESRGGENGSYAKFEGTWDLINVGHYSNLSFSDDWTIQGDFLIENTTGFMNQKPVLLQKMATLETNKNYSISFNKNGKNHIFFEYELENGTNISLEIDDAGIIEGNWYTFYFARSVENNIVEARVYDQNRNLLSSTIKQINGEESLLTGAGDLYLGIGNPNHYEECLQGGLDNIIISDIYSSKLMSNSTNNAPVLSDIPNQTINEGDQFTTIDLNEFVFDLDDSDDEISWSYEGNTELNITLDENSVASISKPNNDWFGTETITFIARDSYGDFDSDEVLLTVIEINNGPKISNITNQTIQEGSSFSEIELDNFISDDDNSVDEILWTFRGNLNLIVTIDDNRIVQVSSPDNDWYGSEIITFIAKDPDNNSASDQVEFTVLPMNDAPIIGNLPDLIEFVSDSSVVVDIWSYVSDVETPVNELVYNFNIDTGPVLYNFDTENGRLLLRSEIENSGESQLIWSVSDNEITITDTIQIIVEKSQSVKIYENEIVPENFSLHQNYPNPFNPSTCIQYALPEDSHVKLIIFNSAGHVVETIVNRKQSAGYHTVVWNASELPSNIYFYKVIAGKYSEVKKCILMK